MNNQEKFSDLLIGELKEIIGEIMFEVSEGMHNGITDFEKKFKKKVESLVTKCIGA